MQTLTTELSVILAFSGSKGRLTGTGETRPEKMILEVAPTMLGGIASPPRGGGAGAYLLCEISASLEKTSRAHAREGTIGGSGEYGPLVSG